MTNWSLWKFLHRFDRFVGHRVMWDTNRQQERDVLHFFFRWTLPLSRWRDE